MKVLTKIFLIFYFRSKLYSLQSVSFSFDVISILFFKYKEKLSPTIVDLAQVCN